MRPPFKRRLEPAVPVKPQLDKRLFSVNEKCGVCGKGPKPCMPIKHAARYACEACVLKTIIDGNAP